MPGQSNTGLGDDRAAEDGGEVDGHDGGERDQRVAQGVADEHPDAREALGPGQCARSRC